MSSCSKSGPWVLCAILQIGLATSCLLALAFAPAEHGRSLLVPINGKPVDIATLDELMLTPMRSGPLPGSVVVEGLGRSVAGTLFERGIIMLAAPAVMCGGPSPGVQS